MGDGVKIDYFKGRNICARPWKGRTEDSIWLFKQKYQRTKNVWGAKGVYVAKEQQAGQFGPSQEHRESIKSPISTSS